MALLTRKRSAKPSPALSTAHGQRGPNGLSAAIAATLDALELHLLACSPSPAKSPYSLRTGVLAVKGLLRRASPVTSRLVQWTVHGRVGLTGRCAQKPAVVAPSPVTARRPMTSQMVACHVLVRLTRARLATPLPALSTASGVHGASGAFAPRLAVVVLFADTVTLQSLINMEAMSASVLQSRKPSVEATPVELTANGMTGTSGQRAPSLVEEAAQGASDRSKRCRSMVAWLARGTIRRSLHATVIIVPWTAFSRIGVLGQTVLCPAARVLITDNGSRSWSSTVESLVWRHS
mmetsp:Transcript_87137/g.154241  ORF Transcript_87137/g.154241 Transcript_87137/m.154241 type:complete len:292 (-) Transcript_87137:824-1699(-)